MAKVLMTKSEIHDFGVQTVFDYLRKNGHEIVSVNTDIGINPQIVSRKDEKLEFIIVRTACYPSNGEIENDIVATECIEFSDKHNATCYFASVGIANSDGSNDSEMAIPVKGAGYYVSFKGLEILTRLDRVRLWGDNNG